MSREVDELIRQLKEQIIRSEHSYDLDGIDRAIQTAVVCHEGQRRQSGEEYVTHPLHVAMILADLGMDSETIEAGLLHDVIEDTDFTLDEVERRFGKDVRKLVDGVTKITKIDFFTKEEQQAENVRKMLLAMAEDIRVIIIKLADRLHNMRTSGGWPPQKSRDKAKETMDIYAPLAHRLGIRSMKEELEDLSLRVLDPVGYHEIEQALALRHDERNALLEELQQRIKERLSEYGMQPYVEGRVKSIPGIYRKIYVQNHTFDEIYDIYAVRVIVDTVNDCYNVLGVMHDLFRPLPNRFKDYISTPKPNMYQSLHTTVLGKEKIPFEIQIRTWEMHYTAEYGIAAHWKYKLGIQGKDKLDERLAWVRQFIENQKDVDDTSDIVRSIRTDLSSDDVFVFTPKGDVISLPQGSTVIDFAYAIHSAVGNRMVGAKIDNRMVPLDTKVKTGQIVEILTSSDPGKGPSRDWLGMVKTGEARNKIRSWFKKERREENIVEGKAAFAAELNRNLIHLNDEQMEALVAEEARRQHCATADDFYAAIGYGGILISRLMPHIKDRYTRQMREQNARTGVLREGGVPRGTPHDGVIVEDMDSCLVKFARCCNPVPGDEIIGFITRGNGVSIHKRDCPNVPADISRCGQPERWVSAAWASSAESEFKTVLHITARDRERLLADVANQLASMHVTIFAINAHEPKDERTEMLITVGVHSVSHLEGVISRLSRIKGVMEVERSLQ